MSAGSAGPAREVPLNGILENTGRELARLARMAGGIDDHIGELLLHPELAAMLSREILQDVDNLRQSVDCLHRLVTNLAARGPADASICAGAAVEGVYLESIRTACLPEP